MDDKNRSIIESYRKAVERYYVRRSTSKAAFAVFDGNGNCVQDGFDSFEEAQCCIEDKKFASEPTLNELDEAINLIRYHKNRALRNGYVSLILMIIIGIGGALLLSWCVLPITILIIYIWGAFWSYRTVKLIEKRTGLTIMEQAVLKSELKNGK